MLHISWRAPALVGTMNQHRFRWAHPFCRLNPIHNPINPNPYGPDVVCKRENRALPAEKAKTPCLLADACTVGVGSAEVGLAERSGGARLSRDELVDLKHTALRIRSPLVRIELCTRCCNSWIKHTLPFSLRRRKRARLLAKPHSRTQAGADRWGEALTI